MTRFTSTLAIATVAFAFVAGFGPGLTQPAFAGKDGHEAAQHEINGGKDSVDHNSADRAGGSSSVDKGGDRAGTNDGKGGGTDRNSADKASGGSSTDKSGRDSGVDKGGEKGDKSADKGGTGTEPAEVGNSSDK